jgi:hypothetical protein
VCACVRKIAPHLVHDVEPEAEDEDGRQELDHLACGRETVEATKDVFNYIKSIYT